MKNIQFDLSKVPFSRSHSYIGISSGDKKGKFYIHCARRVFGEDIVFEMEFYLENKFVIPEIDFQPHRIFFM